MVNLSQVTLTKQVLDLLSRGLTFCPTPLKLNHTELRADLADFIRRLRLQEYFYDPSRSHKEAPRFRNKSSWTLPHNREIALEAFIKAVEEDVKNITPYNIGSNLTVQEKEALHNLMSRTDIIVKPADKGSATVVMDREWYLRECYRQLENTNFCEKTNEDKTPKVCIQVKRYVDGLLLDGFVDENTHGYLIIKEPRPSRFYISPKIHKQGNPGRPIVSANDHPTERISEFVDRHLNPEAPKLPLYIKDTTHFLTKLNSLKDIPPGAILVTLDIASLYTNIPHKDGIQACRDALDRPTHRETDTHRETL